MVIERKIDEGQTLAAQFQTPELSSSPRNAARDARLRLGRRGRHRPDPRGQARQPVKFTVDAYPDDLFQGKIDRSA